MAIRNFAVGPVRSLERAEANDLGNLVVLAGPNGAGKSTLLDLLRQQRAGWAEPGTTVMFVGPHRTWRSSSINKVSLYGFPMASYGALLESDNLPNWQYGPPQGMAGLQGTPGFGRCRRRAGLRKDQSRPPSRPPAIPRHYGLGGQRAPGPGRPRPGPLPSFRTAHQRRSAPDENRVGDGVAPSPPTPPDMRARIRRFV